MRQLNVIPGRTNVIGGRVDADLKRGLVRRSLDSRVLGRVVRWKRPLPTRLFGLQLRGDDQTAALATPTSR